MPGLARMGGAAAAVVLLWGGPAWAGGVVVALPGGGGTAYAAALTRAVGKAPPGRGKFVVTKLPAELGAAGWDVALLDPLVLADACAAHRLAAVDWAAFGGRGRFLPMAASGCGVGATLSSTVLAWDAAKVKSTPGWGDFWDVSRLPGRRGLRASPVGTLEIALMADGVAPRDVYATLGGKDGVERAFRKLDQLRPYIVWWHADTEPAAIVAGGGALMSSAPSDQVATAGVRLHRRFGVQWQGAIASVQSWAIRAGSARVAPAVAFIQAAGDPAVAGAVYAQTGLAGVLVPEPGGVVADGSPAAHLAQALPLDAAFWHDHRAALTRRFDDWLKH